MGRGAARKKRRAIARGEIPKEPTSEPVKQPSALEKTLAESRTPRADNRLIARAARARWDISESDRKLVVDRMVNIVSTNDKARDVINAARALISIDSLNLQAEQADKPDSAIPVESEQTSTSQELREQILREPDYLEYRRQVAASAGNGDTGVVRSVDQPGTLEAGPASD